MEQLQELLSSQDASSSNCLDFLLGSAREEPGLDNNWLLGKNTFTQNLVKTSSRAVNNWSLIGLSSILCSCLFRNKRPQFVQVDAGLIQVGVVGMNVEVPHSNLSKVSRMIFVKVDSVMVLATSVSTTSGMLPVLPNSSMTMGDVSSQLPGLLLGCGHSGTLLLL